MKKIKGGNNYINTITQVNEQQVQNKSVNFLKIHSNIYTNIYYI